MNQPFRPTPAPFPAHRSPKALRGAIDQIATLRARVIRVGFSGTLLYRPDPATPATDEETQITTDLLRADVGVIHSVCHTLASGSEMEDAPSDIAQWINQVALQDPAQLARITALATLSQHVLDAVESGSPKLGDAIHTHMQISRGGFFEDVTALCEALWLAIYEQVTLELSQTTQAAQTLAGRLDRLERIGKHVRIVSLNASVEASRAGDVGRGLMIIAQEFKSLAEEIQALAKDARQDIEAIS